MNIKYCDICFRERKEYVKSTAEISAKVAGKTIDLDVCEECLIKMREISPGQYVSNIIAGRNPTYKEIH